MYRRIVRIEQHKNTQFALILTNYTQKVIMFKLTCTHIDKLHSFIINTKSKRFIKIKTLFEIRLEIE